MTGLDIFFLSWIYMKIRMWLSKDEGIKLKVEKDEIF